MTTVLQMAAVIAVMLGDPITNGLTTLADQAKVWLGLLAVIAGVTAYGLHAAGYRHASDVMRNAFVGLAAAAILCFGAPWFIGLFKA